MKLMEMRPILIDNDFFQILSEIDIVQIVVTEDVSFSYLIEIETENRF